jgi:TM2 domain-containing membrane protein YozV
VNHRRTKISGLILIGIGGLVLGVSIAIAAQPEWLQTATRVQLAWAAVGWWIGGNTFALGVILLMAGLQEVPLHRGARGRRGVLVKIAGTNLLLLAGVGFTFGESRVPAESWLAVIGLIGLIAVIRSGVILLRTGWKYDALSAEQARARDPRPPVVYLRSFHQDEEMAVAGGRAARLWQRLAPFMTPAYVSVVDPEQEMAMMFHRVGPVIGIGQPGEPLPDLGAARMYVADDRWRATVDGLLAESSVVLIRAGSTPNLWWEIEEAMKLVPRQRIVIVSLLDRDASVEFDRAFTERFGTATRLEAPPVPPWLALLKRMSRYRPPPWRIVFFDEAGRACDVPIGFAITWTGYFLLMTGRPYRDMLFEAMERVFAAQGRPWVTPRTHTTAVLMALFGGIIGLHRFYLGDSKGGWRRVRYCWTMVPLVAGLRETVRLALIDRRDFDRQYPGPAWGSTGVRPGFDQGQTGVRPGSDHSAEAVSAANATTGTGTSLDGPGAGATERSDPGLTPD